MLLWIFLALWVGAVLGFLIGAMFSGSKIEQARIESWDNGYAFREREETIRR